MTRILCDILNGPDAPRTLHLDMPAEVEQMTKEDRAEWLTAELAKLGVDHDGIVLVWTK